MITVINYLGLTFEQHGLLDKAITVGVGWVWTSDVAKFSVRRGHTNSSRRLVDIDAKDSLIGERIFSNGTDENGNIQLKNYHTKIYVITW